MSKQVTTKVSLVDYSSESDKPDKLQVNHAVPSAKKRIEFAKVMSDNAPKKDADSIQSKLTKIAFEGGVGESNSDALKRAIDEGDITVEDILELNEISVEATEENCKMVFNLFRVAVDTRTIKSGWKEKLDDDDFMMEQNFVEVRDFVDSFRDLYEPTARGDS